MGVQACSKKRPVLIYCVQVSSDAIYRENLYSGIHDHPNTGNSTSTNMLMTLYMQASTQNPCLLASHLNFNGVRTR